MISNIDIAYNISDISTVRFSLPLPLVVSVLALSLACVGAVLLFPVCLVVHCCVESPDVDDQPSLIHRIWPCLPMDHERDFDHHSVGPHRTSVFLSDEEV